MKSQLGSKHVSETILRTLWMERLPSWASEIIAPMSRSTALDDLADSADLVFERSHKITSVQASISTESQTAKELRAMKEMMANLQKQLHEMKVIRRPRSRDRMHSRHRCPRTPSNHRTNDPDICWYHQTFGDRTKKMQATLQIHVGLGKLGNRRVTTTNPSSNELKTYRLFYIWDRTNEIKFLVDTGAAISVIPHTIDPSAKPTLLKLQAANGSTIDMYGGKTLTLNIGMRRDYTWTFTLANVKIPILKVFFFIQKCFTNNLQPVGVQSQVESHQWLKNGTWYLLA